MRTKLGLAVASMTISSVFVFGTGTSAQTTPDETSTTTETTTTTVAIDGPIIIHSDETVDGDAGDPFPPIRGSQIVIDPPPSTTTTTLPPPPTFGLPANSGSGFRAVYSKSMQKVWVVADNGAILKEHRVSGKLTSCDPNPGTYSVYSRSRYTFSIQNPSLIWGFMIRFAKGCQGGNIGFHEIPTNTNTGRLVQSISQLGTPLSGGCVRQGVDDAIWMWNHIGVGTTVVVLP